MITAKPFSLLVLILLVCSSAHAQLPATRLTSIFPSGGNPGKTVEVTIGGADLDDVDSLRFSHPGITAKQKLAEPGPFDKAPLPVVNQFVITIAGNVPAGVYEIRAAGKYGTSNPRLFTIGTLGETIEIEPNSDREKATEITLPVVVNGQANQAADVDYFKFTAGANQRIIVNGFARRIDSRMDAVVSVYDAVGRELGNNRNGHRGDPVVDFTTRGAGEYFVKVNDAVHLGGPEYFYRLSISATPHIDYVFPLAGLAGRRQFTVFGRNLPGGQPAGQSLDGRPLQKLNVTVALSGAGQNSVSNSLVEPASGGLDLTEYRVNSPLGPSNAVLVGTATAPPINEAEPNDSPEQAQKIVAPCEVQARFGVRGDYDWYQFEAAEDENLTIEVISARMGLPTNVSLLVVQVVKPAEGDQPEQIRQLSLLNESAGLDSGLEFDTRHNDPEYQFTAPADGVYRVLVRDVHNAIRNDPRHVYRLAFRKPSPDFRLVATPEESFSAVLLRKGGQQGIRVTAFRRDGFDGEIALTATGLPVGVTCSGGVIGPSRSTTTITLVAAANAAGASGIVQITGMAKVGRANVARPAQFGAAVEPLPMRAANNQARPAVNGRLARDLLVSVSAEEAAPATIQAGGGKIWETSRGGILKIPYTRAGAFKGKMTLFAQDMPANVEAPTLTINPNAAGGEYQIKLKNNTPTGTYAFCLVGLAEQVDYARNPEAAKRAADRKIEVDKIKAEVDAQAKAAADAKGAADKLATDMGNAAKSAGDAKAAADKALADATVAAKAATDKATQANSATAANPADANLKNAATAAQQAATSAAAKLKDATAAVTVAQKMLDDATTKAAAAAEAKLKTDATAAEMAERAKQAAELKARTDKLATDTANAAKPKKVNVSIISTPVTLKITSAPITFSPAKPGTPLKQGQKLDVPITIARLYGFKAAVNVTVTLPSGVAGLSIPNVSVPANQAATKLTATAAANATLGDHEIKVRAAMNFNGQNLAVEETIVLNVQKVDPPK